VKKGFAKHTESICHLVVISIDQVFSGTKFKLEHLQARKAKFIFQVLI